MADAHAGPERPPGRGARHERGPLELDRPRLEVLAPAERDRVGQRVDAADVARRAEGDTEPLSLAHGEPGAPAVLPHPLPVQVDDRPGRRRPTRAVAQGVAVVAARHEADLLALRLVSGREPQLAGDLAHLGLGQLAEREPRVLELVLAEPVQEVGLVLGLVAGPQEPGAAVIAGDPPRVVTGGHRLALVEVAGATEQGAELHVRVAVDARTRRPTVQVRIQEGLQDAGIELALEVHDVERDVELGGDPPGVVRGIERAAALLDLGVRVGDIVQPHPDAHDLVSGLVQERRRDRRVDAARHGDEDPAHAGTPWPRGSAATIAAPTRIDATTRGTISQAVAISSSVVVRPSDRRRAPRASSSG